MNPNHTSPAHTSPAHTSPAHTSTAGTRADLRRSLRIRNAIGIALALVAGLLWGATGSTQLQLGTLPVVRVHRATLQAVALVACLAAGYWWAFGRRLLHRAGTRR